MNRVINTAAELDALPVGSVIMCDDEHGVAKRVDADRSDGYDWLVVGSDEYRETHEMTWVLPATVLHDPSAPVVPSATREDVVKVLMDHAHDEGINTCECGEWDEWDEEDWDERASAWSAHVHDALAARFTITPRADR